MATCNHGERTFKQGTAQNGKPWKGWFCPTPKGTPDQCPPEWVRDQATNTAAIVGTKDECIMRQVACKVVGARMAYGMDAVTECEKWVSYMKNGSTVAKAASAAQTPVPVPSENITVEEIPF